MAGADPRERLEALDAVCTALAHAARRQILLTVHFRGGEMTAGDIAGRFAHAWPTTTRHLRVLEDAGLLRHERVGRTRVYRLRRERLAVAEEWLAWFDRAGAGGGDQMADAKPWLTKMREICLALPDTKETPTWGKPHFRVGEKIFAGADPDEPRIGFELEMEHAARRIETDPRFMRAPYVGHKGWVDVDASRVRDWEEIRALVLESYRLIAPKRTLAKLEGGVGPAKKAARRGPAAGAKKKARAASRPRAKKRAP